MRLGLGDRQHDAAVPRRERLDRRHVDGVLTVDDGRGDLGGRVVRLAVGRRLVRDGGQPLVQRSLAEVLVGEDHDERALDARDGAQMRLAAADELQVVARERERHEIRRPDDIDDDGRLRPVGDAEVSTEVSTDVDRGVGDEAPPRSEAERMGGDHPGVAASRATRHGSPPSWLPRARHRCSDAVISSKHVRPPRPARKPPSHAVVSATAADHIFSPGRLLACSIQETS